MRTTLTGVFSTLALAASLGFSSSAKAATIGDYLAENGAEVSISASVDYYSKYVWRGFLLDDDNVIQPGVTISFYGFEGGFWGSWDLEGDDSLASDEVDGWIGYNFDLGFLSEDLEMVGVSVGHTWYDFPEAGAQAKEFYLSIALDTILSPYVTWYHDYSDEGSGGADGNYINVGVGHSLDINSDYGVTLDLGAEVGFNNEAFINGDGGYGLLTAGLTLPFSDNATISPSIGYSIPFGDLEDDNDGNQDEEFYAGVSFGFEM